MFLTERTPPASEDMPFQAFRDHLRLGTGFSDDDVQDALLERFLRGAIGQIETLCGKAVLQRDFTLSLNAWREVGRQGLPRAPLVEVTALTIHDPSDNAKIVDPNSYRIHQDDHRPQIVSYGHSLPHIAIGGRATIDFTAGYGASWEAVPAGLMSAVIALAARQYEDRTALAAIPPDVQSALAPYRQPRLLGVV